MRVADDRRSLYALVIPLVMESKLNTPRLLFLLYSIIPILRSEHQYSQIYPSLAALASVCVRRQYRQTLCQMVNTELVILAPGRMHLRPRTLLTPALSMKQDDRDLLTHEWRLSGDFFQQFLVELSRERVLILY